MPGTCPLFRASSRSPSQAVLAPLSVRLHVRAARRAPARPELLLAGTVELLRGIPGVHDEVSRYPRVQPRRFQPLIVSQYPQSSASRMSKTAGIKTWNDCVYGLHASMLQCYIM